MDSAWYLRVVVGLALALGAAWRSIDTWLPGPSWLKWTSVLFGGRDPG